MTISVERAFKPPCIVCAADRPPRFSGIVATSGMLKSILNRLLGTLFDQRLARFDADE